MHREKKVSGTFFLRQGSSGFQAREKKVPDTLKPFLTP